MKPSEILAKRFEDMKKEGLQDFKVFWGENPSPDFEERCQALIDFMDAPQVEVPLEYL